MSISVSTLVKYLKNKLDSDDKLQNVIVTGELSNFHIHSSGHLYFTLKDEKAAIACVMFSSKAKLIKFTPKNGDQVEVHANVSLFEVSGQLQLYVNVLKPLGLGDLYQQYEELKNKLTLEGYFLLDHKKEISTLYPSRVAVLVGNESAAMSDIKTCFFRRWPLCDVTYYPVLVQGKDAAIDIIEKLKIVDEKKYDAIILARGGGSFEDLFCFNDEELVKTIYNLKTFIVSGVGHEQDFTLTDFVCDLRAPTPTAAVELITPNISDVLIDLESIQNKLFNTLNSIYTNTSLKLDYYESKIDSYHNKLNLIETNIDSIKFKIDNLIKQTIKKQTNKVDSLEKLLNTLSIDNTLKRGFSLVYKSNELINSKNKTKKHDILDIKLSDGRIKVKVEE